MHQPLPLSDDSKSDCAQEKIHIPGAIQPHGVLIAVTEQALLIVQASQSSFALFGTEPESLIGRPLNTLIGEAQQCELAQNLSTKPTQNLNPLRLTVQCTNGKKEFDAVIHRSDGLLILEFEESVALQPADSIEFFRTSTQAIAQLLACDTRQQLFQSSAEFVRSLTGFDRVLVYLFDKEWNGTVLAECKSASAKSYLESKFPASDIPAQARELYKRNRLRLLVDVEAQPSPIIPAHNPITSEPLDLSASVLRAMSPVHIEYLINMEVASSMSLSIVTNGELRGLIACHHNVAKHVDYQVRQACDFVAQMVSLRIDAIEERERLDWLNELKDIRKDFLLHTSNEDDLPSAIASSGMILKLVAATGAAVVWDGRCILVGKTPDESKVIEMVAELTETSLPIFVTHEAKIALRSAKGVEGSASGVLAIRITPSGSQWILWFRPEQIEEVKWAGKQEKPEHGDKIHPRKSFEIWKERSVGKSATWSSTELQSVLELRTDILELTLSMFEKKRAEDLKRQVDELDSLAQQLRIARDAAIDASRRKSEMVSVVSHDLKAPLTSIRGSLSLLHSGLYEMPAEGAELTTIALTGCDYLLNLINSLLNLDTFESGGVPIQKAVVSIGKLINDAFELVHASADSKGMTLVAEVEADMVMADKDRVLQVIVNLLSNAIKFSPSQSRIVVSAQSKNQTTTVKVIDQGRGIPDEFKESIFHRFQQVEDNDRTVMGGTGLGLAICKTFVEAHGGRIGVDSEVGVGSTFWFSLDTAYRETRD